MARHRTQRRKRRRKSLRGGSDSGGGSSSGGLEWKIVQYKGKTYAISSAHPNFSNPENFVPAEHLNWSGLPGASHELDLSKFKWQ